MSPNHKAVKEGGGKKVGELAIKNKGFHCLTLGSPGKGFHHATDRSCLPRISCFFVAPPSSLQQKRGVAGDVGWFHFFTDGGRLLLGGWYQDHPNKIQCPMMGFNLQLYLSKHIQIGVAWCTTSISKQSGQTLSQPNRWVPRVFSCGESTERQHQ